MKAVAVRDDHRRLAVRAGTSIDIFELGEGGQSARELARDDDLPISGTHDALAWSPDGQALAYAGRRLAHVFDEALNTIHIEPMAYPSDVAFSPDGRLLALGDWSRGLVLAWPPPAIGDRLHRRGDPAGADVS